MAGDALKALSGGSDRSEHAIAKAPPQEHDPLADVRGLHLTNSGRTTDTATSLPPLALVENASSTPAAAVDNTAGNLANSVGNSTDSNKEYSKADAENTARTVGKFSDAELKAFEENLPEDKFKEIMKHMQDNPNDQANIDGWKGTAHDMLPSPADQAMDQAHKLGMDNEEINGLKRLCGEEGMIKTMEAWSKMDPKDAQDAATQLKHTLDTMLGRDTH